MLRIASRYKLGWTPEEVSRRNGHISLAQVHAALAYYLANQEAMDAEMAADDAEYDAPCGRAAGSTRPGETLTIRLDLDEDAMDDDLVNALRTRGVDVQTVTRRAWPNAQTTSNQPTPRNKDTRV